MYQNGWIPAGQVPPPPVGQDPYAVYGVTSSPQSNPDESSSDGVTISVNSLWVTISVNSLWVTISVNSLWVIVSATSLWIWVIHLHVTLCSPASVGLRTYYFIFIYSCIVLAGVSPSCILYSTT